MLSPVSFASRDKVPARLAEIYAKLGEPERRSLLDFAEFLLVRGGENTQDGSSEEPLEPAHHPRPETESVVAAVKRLSRTYYMLDRQQLFSRTSELMSAHILQGRAAEEVIDDLEVAFREHYRSYRESFEQ
jgi:hypothetical protein